MSQNVQIGISKFHGIWTLALTDTVTLNSLNDCFVGGPFAFGRVSSDPQKALSRSKGPI